MFRYEEPQFEKKRLLRIEMLEELRDYPRSYWKIFYRGYSQGIISGCEITWDSGVLTIAPGILYHGGNLYFMEHPYTLECRAEDKVRYLKVQFLTEVRENGKITGDTRIMLDDKKADSSCEIELCRFRLQEGARLRDSYENLEDYSTEYDTINLIHAPYAAPGQSTLHPQILRQFAKECLESQMGDSLDTSFAMNILGNYGQIPESGIRIYLNTRLGQAEADNQGLYTGLLEILKNQKQGTAYRGRNDGKKKQVMLL